MSAVYHRVLASHVSCVSCVLSCNAGSYGRHLVDDVMHVYLMLINSCSWRKSFSARVRFTAAPGRHQNMVAPWYSGTVARTENCTAGHREPHHALQHIITSCTAEVQQCSTAGAGATLAGIRSQRSIVLFASELLPLPFILFLSF